MHSTEVPLTRYLTVTQWAQEHPWPTAAGIRHLRFENRDGFNDRCVKRVGRRILLDESAFLSWIDDHGE